MSLDDEKRVAAEAAADLIEDGMSVGLGTGSTVAHLLAAVARRGRDIRCVSTSPRTEEAARGLGIRTESFDDVTALDLAIDGADQVSPDWWLVKGGGAAHTREKLVAAAAERFVVIVDSTKLVERITAPVPLELLAFGLGSTLARLGDAALRDVPRTPDGGVIADYTGPVADPAALANLLSATAGVVDHGLFPPTMVAAIVVGEGDEARWLERLPG
ncbi:MAG: ribose 5-phosphate isomerase A [Candidatus Nanopelagicales bacterium]